MPYFKEPRDPSGRQYACSLSFWMSAPLIVVVVQRVYAVGKPPDGKICFFSELKNVVVLPAIGMHYQEAFFLHMIDACWQETVRWRRASLAVI